MEHEEWGDDSTAVYEYGAVNTNKIDGQWDCPKCGACNAPWISDCACCEGDK